MPPVVDFEFTGNPEKFDRQKVYTELKICIDALEKYYGHKEINNEWENIGNPIICIFTFQQFKRRNLWQRLQN